MRLARLSDDILRRTLSDDAAARRAALGSEIDDPVSIGDDIEVVLDDDHRVAGVDQSMQDPDQLLDVRHVQSDRRFIEDVQRGSVSSAAAARLHRTEQISAHFGQFGDELDPLGLAP